MSSPSLSDMIQLSNLKNLDLVFVKLVQQNYLLWKSQFLAIFRNHDFVAYVDGSLKCPSQFITHDGVSTINPAYSLRVKQDQHLASWIMATWKKVLLA